MLKRSERQPTPLDEKLVVEGAVAAVRASNKLLDTLALPEADQGEFEAIARELAQVLCATLEWMPRWREDDRQLHEALCDWLP